MEVLSKSQGCTAFPAPILKKITKSQQHYVKICYTKFEKNLTINVEITGTNSCTFLCNARYSVAIAEPIPRN